MGSKDRIYISYKIVMGIITMNILTKIGYKINNIIKFFHLYLAVEVIILIIMVTEIIIIRIIIIKGIIN